MPSTAFAIAVLTTLVAHDLPDKVVDRGVQLIVSKDRIEVQYEVGMNLRSAAEVLRRHAKLPADWKDADLDSPRAAELLPLIRRHLFEALPGQMKLVMGGKDLPLQGLRYVPSAKQHTLVRATYSAPFQTSTPIVQLEFRDDNFPSQPGWLRIAAKPRGAASIVEASTGLLLVRMTRDLEKPQTAEQLANRRAVSVSFQVPDEMVVAAAVSTKSSTAADSDLSDLPDEEKEKEAVQRPHPAWFLAAFALMAVMALWSFRRESRRGGGR